MASVVPFTKKQLDMAKSLRDNPVNVRDHRAGLVVLFMSKEGRTREEAAELFGIDIRTVYTDMERVRSPDKQQKGQWGGARHCLMTSDEEEEFLAEYEDEAKAGFIITMPELHAKYDEKVGKKTPESTFYRMLKRHGWRKVLPDTRHPKADPAVQEEFKKKLLRYRWTRLSKKT